MEQITVAKAVGLSLSRVFGSVMVQENSSKSSWSFSFQLYCCIMGLEGSSKWNSQKSDHNFGLKKEIFF